jgi:hypothetical protein
VNSWAPGPGQPPSRTRDGDKRTGAGDGQGLRHSDAEVGEAVAIEVANSQRHEAEAVERLGAAGDSRAVAGEQLAAGAGQPPSRPTKDVDRARILSGANVLGATDGQVHEAVAAEVASGKGQAEVVAQLGDPGHPGAVLGKELAADSVSPSRTEQHVDRPAAVGGTVVLAGSADGQVGEAVAVEVANVERVAELVVPLGDAGDPRAVLGEELAAGTRQPAAVPYSTFTAPASTTAPTSSNDTTPTARSAKRSPSKSPTASASPKPSPGSATPGTPALS